MINSRNLIYTNILDLTPSLSLLESQLTNLNTSIVDIYDSFFLSKSYHCLVYSFLNKLILDIILEMVLKDSFYPSTPFDKLPDF